MRLLGILNSVLKHIALRRQKLGDFIKARHAFAAGAIDQLANLKFVAAHEGLPWYCGTSGMTVKGKAYIPGIEVEFV